MSCERGYGRMPKEDFTYEQRLRKLGCHNHRIFSKLKPVVEPGKAKSTKIVSWKP